jgi:hypothetical protein
MPYKTNLELFEPVALAYLDEVRDGLMANRDAIAREILAGLQPLLMEGQAGFQVQIGGLPPGTNFVFGGPQGPAQ